MSWRRLSSPPAFSFSLPCSTLSPSYRYWLFSSHLARLVVSSERVVPPSSRKERLVGRGVFAIRYSLFAIRYSHAPFLSALYFPSVSHRNHRRASYTGGVGVSYGAIRRTAMGYAGGVERGKDAKAGGRGEANAVSRTKAIAGGNRGGARSDENETMARGTRRQDTTGEENRPGKRNKRIGPQANGNRGTRDAPGRDERTRR